MDLKNNKITIKELLKNEDAAKIFRREFGELMNHPMLKTMSSMSLERLIKLGQKHIEADRIKKILEELGRI